MTKFCVGQNRATVSAPKIAELNPYVKVTSTAADLSKDLSILNDFKVRMRPRRAGESDINSDIKRDTERASF